MNYFTIGNRNYQFLPDGRVFWSRPHSQHLGTVQTTAQALSLAARHAALLQSLEDYEARRPFRRRESAYPGRKITEA